MILNYNNQMKKIDKTAQSEKDESTAAFNQQMQTETKLEEHNSNANESKDMFINTESETLTEDEEVASSIDDKNEVISHRYNGQPQNAETNHVDKHSVDATVSHKSNSVNQQNQSMQASQESKTTIRKGPNIKLPSIDLLDEPKVHEVDNQWIEEKKQELNEAFYYFNVPAEVQTVTEGPSVTRFELSVEKGVKVSRITNLQDDIKMALAAKDIRIEAPIPGTSLVGIEVPNQSSTPVNLRSIIEDNTFKNAESKLTVAMGLRINNEPLVMDIAKRLMH